MKKFYIILSSISFIFLIVLIRMYNYLPSMLPNHWQGINGMVDGFTSKQSLLAIWVVLFFTALILLFLEQNNFKKSKKTPLLNTIISVSILGLFYSIFTILSLYYIFK